MALHLDSYVNFHELNLDYFLQKLKENSEDIAKMKDTLQEFAEEYIQELLANGQILIQFTYNAEFKRLDLVFTTPEE